MINEDQRKAADIVSKILLELKELTAPGVSLDMLEELAERRILEEGGEPLFKGYISNNAKDPFPSCLCASIEFEAAHAAPKKISLAEGTIIKYDLGVKYKSGCADACITVAVGKVDNRRQRAMRHGLKALYKGIKVVKAGVAVSEIGKAIEKHCDKEGYRIIKGLQGHHIGIELHEKPNIPNFYDPMYSGLFLKEGDVICIEPHITPGKGDISLWIDDWTVFTVDHQPVVAYEHMVLITKDGYEILTNWDK